jgi:Mn2+/Fe2+ NRAMP family transporter
MAQAGRDRPAIRRLRRFFAALEPGVISGAADDDPSSIGTYSVVGAQFGTSVLWTALITWPLVTVVQLMCGVVRCHI